METRSCPGCGKFFNYLGPTTPACPSCMKIREEKFQKCKDYLRDNPRVGVQEVAEANEVSTKTVMQWVREGRLTFAEGSGVGIPCMSCGANILTGKYCTACASRLKSDIAGVVQSARPQPEAKKSADSAKMRFLKE